MSFWKKLFGLGSSERATTKPEAAAPPAPEERTPWAQLDPVTPEVTDVEPLSEESIAELMALPDGESAWAQRLTAAFLVPAEEGASRLGGLPQLPEGHPWPEYEGAPMAFLGQIDLAEAAPHLDEGWPSEGMLLFFVHHPVEADGSSGEIMYDPEPGEYTVVHTTEPGPERPWPDALPQVLRTPECRVGFAPRVTVPELRTVEPALQDRAAYEAWFWRNTVAGARVGGRVRSSQDDVRWSFQGGPFEEARVHFAEWRLLFAFQWRVDPEPYAIVMDGCWGIREADLRAGRFEEAVLCFQSP